MRPNAVAYMTEWIEACLSGNWPLPAQRFDAAAAASGDPAPRSAAAELPAVGRVNRPQVFRRAQGAPASGEGKFFGEDADGALSSVAGGRLRFSLPAPTVFAHVYTRHCTPLQLSQLLWEALRADVAEPPAQPPRGRSSPVAAAGRCLRQLRRLAYRVSDERLEAVRIRRWRRWVAEWRRRRRLRRSRWIADADAVADAAAGGGGDAPLEDGSGGDSGAGSSGSSDSAASDDGGAREAPARPLLQILKINECSPSARTPLSPLGGHRDRLAPPAPRLPPPARRPSLAAPVEPALYYRLQPDASMTVTATPPRPPPAVRSPSSAAAQPPAVPCSRSGRGGSPGGPAGFPSSAPSARSPSSGGAAAESSGKNEPSVKKRAAPATPPAAAASPAKKAGPPSADAPVKGAKQILDSGEKGGVGKTGARGPGGGKGGRKEGGGSAAAPRPLREVSLDDFSAARRPRAAAAGRGAGLVQALRQAAPTKRRSPPEAVRHRTAALSLSPDGRTLQATEAYSRTVSFFDLQGIERAAFARHREGRSWDGPLAPTRQVALAADCGGARSGSRLTFCDWFSPDTAGLAATELGGELAVWDCGRGGAVRLFRERLPAPATHFAPLDASGAELAVAAFSARQPLSLVDFRCGAVVATFRRAAPALGAGAGAGGGGAGGGAAVLRGGAVCTAVCGRLVAAGFSTGDVALWDLRRPGGKVLVHCDAARPPDADAAYRSRTLFEARQRGCRSRAPSEQGFLSPALTPSSPGKEPAWRVCRLKELRRQLGVPPGDPVGPPLRSPPSETDSAAAAEAKARPELDWSAFSSGRKPPPSPVASPRARLPGVASPLSRQRWGREKANDFGATLATLRARSAALAPPAAEGRIVARGDALEGAAAVSELAFCGGTAFIVAASACTAQLARTLERGEVVRVWDAATGAAVGARFFEVPETVPLFAASAAQKRQAAEAERLPAGPAEIPEATTGLALLRPPRSAVPETRPFPHRGHLRGPDGGGDDGCGGLWIRLPVGHAVATWDAATGALTDCSAGHPLHKAPIVHCAWDGRRAGNAYAPPGTLAVATGDCDGTLAAWRTPLNWPS